MNENILQNLSTVDVAVFFAILLLTVASVIYGTKIRDKEKSNSKEKSALEVLLDGRSLTLPLFIATLVSTWYGGIFGVTQIAYEYGIYNFITQGFFWYVTYLLFAFFLSDKLRKSDAKTLPELAGSLFGPQSKKLVSVFNILNVLPIAYAMSLGIFIDTVFSTGIVYGTLIGTSVVVLYSILGGFRAIVFSDLIQFFVMILSVILVLVFSIQTFGGMSFLKENLPKSHFSVTGGLPISSLIVWGLIALSTLVDPNFYQRVFAAQDAKTAKKGIIVSTIIWCLFDICTTAGAMYAAATIKGAESSQAYLLFAMEVLPAGAKGLFLAGILATILSTLDSYLFIGSSTVVYDLLEKKNGLLKSHHITTIIFGLLAALLSFYFSGGIKDVWKTLGSYSAGCLLLPMMLALWTKIKIKDMEFLWASILGVIGITAWRHIERHGFWKDFDDLFIGILCTATIIFIFQVKRRLGFDSH